jgi:putative oxidoreductase
VPAEYGFPAAIAAATIEALGALCILFGFMTRIAALVMAPFAVIAACLGHRFWEITDPTRHLVK